MFAIIYLVALLTELFVPSYYGSLLTNKSERLTYKFFKGDWTKQTVQFKRTMMIFIERTLKSITIRVGGVFALNLTTMLQVIVYFSIRTSMIEVRI